MIHPMVYDLRFISLIQVYSLGRNRFFVSRSAAISFKNVFDRDFSTFNPLT